MALSSSRNSIPRPLRMTVALTLTIIIISCWNSCHGFSSSSSFVTPPPSSPSWQQQRRRQLGSGSGWAARSNQRKTQWMSLKDKNNEEKIKLSRKKGGEEETASLTTKKTHETKSTTTTTTRKMELSWCGRDTCTHDEYLMRERVVVNPKTGWNDIVFEGPATGQVLFEWSDDDDNAKDDPDATIEKEESPEGKKVTPSVLLLVKRNDDDLMITAASAVQNLTSHGVRVLLHPEHAAKLKHYFGVDNDENMIALFEPKPVPGFGGSHVAKDDIFMSSGFDPMAAAASATRAVEEMSSRKRDGILAPPSFSSSVSSSSSSSSKKKKEEEMIHPDLICTLGGDGLLMHVSMLFPGPAPPVLCVAGGSLGFLTPFSKEEMCDAIFIALGMKQTTAEENDGTSSSSSITPNIQKRQYSIPIDTSTVINGESVEEDVVRPQKITFGSQNAICLSMRMRLDCRVINREGVVRARFNVLNEVTIDRGSSPYLAYLECFCDNVHLTTVQADGVIFSTPTGSTAYSMAAGGSVVHPAVPAILVTPICPHVLSFRSMVLPDHVVLRCYVPDDARSDAIVAFDGKYRRELHRGDSVQVQMSVHPLPTINREDHSSDWLSSLKRNFNFNTRARQQPL